MTESAEPSDRAAFIKEPAIYKRKVVAFYDIMGWGTKITDAGDNIERVTQLKNIVRMFSALRGERGSGTEFAERMTSFSDNVVVSTTTSPNAIITWVIRLGMTQLLGAQIGFLIRGGVTIGKIVHDDYVVFGPALNRAYYLECEVADKPRIVLDSDCVAELGELTGLTDVEDGVQFLNPWTRAFAGIYLTMTNKTGDPTYELVKVMQYLGWELRRVAEEKNRRRLIWLYKRIAREIGLPSSGMDDILDTL
jgi:hypothetical protein